MLENESLKEGALVVLNSIPGAAAIIDKEGEIVEANQQWKSSSTSSNWLGVKPDGTNFFDHCRNAIEQGNDYALKLILGIRSVFENPKKNVELTISAGNNGQKSWCKVFISKLHKSPLVLVLFDDITKNMNTIQLQRESNELYSKQFNHSTAGILIDTPDGAILDVNPAACSILGYTKEELKMEGRSLIVHEDNPAHLKMKNIRNKNSRFKGEIEYIHKNGMAIPVDIHSVLYRNPDGEQQIMNIFHDKSTEKHLQFSLDEERLLSKTAVDSIPGIFFVIDTELKIVRWNKTVEDKLGYKNDELLSMDLLYLLHPKDKNKVRKHLKKMFENGAGEMIVRIIDTNGNSHTYNLNINRFNNKKSDFLVSTGIDITDFLTLEKEKSEHHALMNQLFDNSPLATVMIDTNNRIKKVNNGFTKLFGYPKDEVLEKNVNSLITDDHVKDESEKMSRDALNGISSQKETVRFNKKKQEIPVLINTVPIKNNGDIIAAYGIYVDLTDQKRLEKKLHQSLREKDVLLQEVHHRVKNNLAIIAGLLELQIMHNHHNRQENGQLKEALTRIFSISNIHETLYQQEDVVSIRFDKYLDKIAKTLPHRLNKRVTNITKHPDSEVLKLNLNQAVPLGLIINELINMGASDGALDDKVCITIKTDNNLVLLIIDGINPEFSELKTGLKPDTFHKLLIKTFLDQIEANIKLTESRTMKIIISFKKSDFMKGSSSSITNQYNLVKKQYFIET